MNSEWSKYCDSLEVWVNQQYEHLTSSVRRTHAAMIEQSKQLNADWMARKFYEREMEKLYQRTAQNLPTHPTSGSAHPNNAARQYHRYVIPHPWRRIIAELIDTFFVLMIKLILIYNLTGDSPLLEFSSYLRSALLARTSDYRTVQRALTKSGLHKHEFSLYKLLQEDTNDLEGWMYNVDLLLIVDHIGRLIGAFIETIFISRALLGRGPGGATLGKWIMNLKVVSCDEIISLPDEVEVYPGTDLGLARAIVRSMLKSTSFLTVLSFVCMLMFQYHRCTYDLIAGTLVVQPVPVHHPQEEQAGHDRNDPNPVPDPQ